MSFTPRYKPYTYYLGSNGDLGDYLLTGTRDDIGIQKAFTGAATQGSADVKLGRGIFNVGAILNITAPGVYSGAGRGATILRASQSIYVSGQDHWKGVLTVTGQTGGLGGVVIRDLTIDCGNMAKTQAWAVQGGNALVGAFVDGVTFENCEFINMAPDINDVASAHGQITSGRHSWGDYGDVSNVRFSHCKFGATNKSHAYIQGNNIKHLKFHECDFQYAQLHSVIYQGYAKIAANPLSSVRSFRDWTFEGCHFQNNHLTSYVGSLCDIHDAGRTGVVGLNIIENHFEGRSGVNQDEISINIMQSWNNTIADNFFDQNCEAISLGTSFGAAYNNISPDFLTTIDRNHFYKCRNITDHDASVFEKWTNNEFFEIEQLTLSGYSRHFLTEYGNNRFYNCPAVKADIDPYYATAIMLTGDGFDVHDNTIIDDRKLPDPTIAPVLSTLTGGALGARTYYVKYTWSNYTGITPPIAPTIAVNTLAGNLRASR